MSFYLPAVWKWLSNAGWVCYDSSVTTKIETAFLRDLYFFYFSIGKWRYRIIFDSMMQENIMTKKRRSIFRDTDEASMWFFLSSSGILRRLSPGLEPHMEACWKEKKPQHRILHWEEMDGVEFVANLNTATCKNKVNSVERRIFRISLLPLNGLSGEKLESKLKFITKFQHVETNLCLNCLHPNKLWRQIKQHIYLQEMKRLLNVELKYLINMKHIIKNGVVKCLGNKSDLLPQQFSPFLSVDFPVMDECAICLEPLAESVVKLYNCTHYYHIQCIRQYIICCGQGLLNCPLCNKIQCVGSGPCPKGIMRWSILNLNILEGYDTGTIIIHYKIPDGTQMFQHENPGKFFRGTERLCFLPDNREGRLILYLLKEAFRMGHIFTVGTSITTGRQNVVVWNGIHHKTSTCGGATCYGFPDDLYFGRVLRELQSKGIEPPRNINDSVADI